MRLHANEVTISDSQVQKLITSQFPAYADMPIKPFLSSGTDNAIYLIGDKLAARLPRIADKEKHIKKEYQWLPWLAPQLPIAIPHPTQLGKPNEDYPFVWAIYDWIEGLPASDSPIIDLNTFADDLANWILALQKLDTTGAPKPTSDFDRGQPLVRRDQNTRKAIAALDNGFNTKELISEWERALNTTPWDKQPVWIHGDLDGRNMLVNDGRLSAVIDFGSMGIGDPAYYVMVAWKMFSGDSRNVFRQRLGVDNAMWARSRGLALSQAAMILSYYTDETNPVLVSEARSWMKELGFE